MIALKGLVLAAAIAGGLLGTSPTPAPPAVPLVARCAYVNPEAQLDPSCVQDAPTAQHAHEPKPKRLPRMRVAQVGARIRIHVTTTI